jgi:hypothetical protein
MKFGCSGLLINKIAKMIKHVVMYKMKDLETVELKSQVLIQFETKLLALKQLIPELKSMEVGRNYLSDNKSFDLCLISEFESLDDLGVYSRHAHHLPVVEFIKPYVAERAAVDYEF